MALRIMGFLRSLALAEEGTRLLSMYVAVNESGA